MNNTNQLCHMKHISESGFGRRFLFALLMLLCMDGSAFARRVGVYCYMGNVGGEVCSDENVCVSLSVGPDGAALLHVENLTDRVVYVDRGNSFAYTNDLSRPLFVPSSSTESHTYSHGIVDAVTPDLAVVDAESHTNSHTVYDQRIVPIAPFGRAVIHAWDYLPSLLRKDMVDIGNTGHGFQYSCKGRFLTASTDTRYHEVMTGVRPFRKGDTRHYTPDASPLALSADVQYCFAESGEDSQRLRVSDYVVAIVVGSYKGVSKNGVLSGLPVGNERQQPCFAFRSGRAAGNVLYDVATVAAAVGLVASIASMGDMPDDPDWFRNAW